MFYLSKQSRSMGMHVTYLELIPNKSSRKIGQYIPFDSETFDELRIKTIRYRKKSFVMKIPIGRRPPKIDSKGSN